MWAQILTVIIVRIVRIAIFSALNVLCFTNYFVPLWSQRKRTTTMNSKILKLDAPYSIIYAGGKIGRHIATLMTWEDDVDGGAEVFEAH